MDSTSSNRSVSMIVWLLLASLAFGGCKQQSTLGDFTLIERKTRHESLVVWGLECHAPPYRNGQLWYFTCLDGSRHAETVEAVDLHDGDGFLPWCETVIRQ